jgi:hypothetical protein
MVLDLDPEASDDLEQTQPSTPSCFASSDTYLAHCFSLPRGAALRRPVPHQVSFHYRTKWKARHLR